MEKIKFETNIPVEVALRFPEGKVCDSQFGDPQYMFSTTDDRVFFVAAKVAQKIHGLRLKAGELIDIVKAEVPYSNNRKGIEWQISRVNPPVEPQTPPVGEQPDGTFAVPVARGIAPAPSRPGASVVAPAPVQAAPMQPPPTTSSSKANGTATGNGNGHNGNGHAAMLPAEAPEPSNPHVVVTDCRPRTRLEDALKTVVAAVHATNEYAKSIGYAMPQFTSEDLRTMANTLIIGAKNGNGNGGGNGYPA